MLMLCYSAQKASSQRRVSASWGMKKCRAFSLVEVLVAISVIALLVAILLPILGKNRSAARRVICLNNLRNMGEANNTYSTDHEGLYCVSNSLTKNSQIEVWYEAPIINPVTGVLLGTKWSYVQYGLLYEDYLSRIGKTYFCPNAGYDIPTSAQPLLAEGLYGVANLGVVGGENVFSNYFFRGLLQGSPRSVNGRAQDINAPPNTYQFIPSRDTKPRRALIADMAKYRNFPNNHNFPLTTNVLYTDMSAVNVPVPKFFPASPTLWVMAGNNSPLAPAKAYGGPTAAGLDNGAWNDLDRQFK